MELAHQAGDAQGLNLVMVGALLGLGLLPLTLDAMKAQVRTSVPVRFLDMNLRALELGSAAVGG